MFEGATAAIVTPFRGGQLDGPALRAVTRHLLAGGIDGIVVVGSTGEGATLTPEERRRALELVLEEAKGRAFVIAGTGTNATDSTIQLTRSAKEAGADGVMLVTPYYNKPTPDGIVRHFEAVARAVELPIIAYNVPSRTGMNLTPATAARLARIPQVVAIKEAAGSLDQTTELVLGSSLTVIAGDDSLTVPMMAVGAKGVISVVANLIPGDVKALVSAMAKGDYETARRLHLRLYPLTKAMFIETNPGPVKHALALLGLVKDELRLPLVPVSEATGREIEGALRSYGLAVGAAA
ncbi:MAG TPA: 4-hydroxy-tetrahydrodipicolinate synthase [Candidatus Udaeobacter sp.]|nr:4-hydroxy-tetrahydrodipicolinate synthase [Candidatus Udaeobacter sp.]